MQIKQEFKRLIPPLTKEEFNQLENNCISEGIREKILTWNGFIIDGHNRYEIATKWDLDFETKSKHFDNEEAVKVWMINNQLGKRNLTELQKSALRGKKLNQRKKNVGASLGNLNAENNSDNLSPLNKTSKIVAQEENVSSRTIERDGNFATGLSKLTPELESAILNKEIKVTKANIQELAKAESTFIATSEKQIQAKAKELKEKKRVEFLEKKAKKLKEKVDATPIPFEESQLIDKLKNGETVVINMNTNFHVLKYAKDNGLYKQIDRYSEYGNPFFLNTDGDRDQVCDGYIEYFKHKRSLHTKVKDLKGKALGCHCAPLRCHGDYLKKLSDEA